MRIGGLLSLERIAQDSTNYDKGRDHVRVMEILCAYVRENAPASEAVDFPLPEWEPLKDDASEEEREAHVERRNKRFSGKYRPIAREWARSLDDPRADIALALRIIGRRGPEQRQVEARWGPEAADEATWVFDTPCPELSDPPGDAPHGIGNLEAYEKDLNAWTNKVRGYRGYRPDLRKTNLQGADLSGLVLSGAVLAGARMEGANLSKARMEGAVLSEARMEGADLSGARMEGADLFWARMEGAVLFGARLSTSLSTAASLRAAALKELDLSKTDLSQDQLDSMFGDGSVTPLPEGTTRPAHWPECKLPHDGDHAFFDKWRKWQADPDG